MAYQFIRKLSDGGFSEVFEICDPASALSESLVLKRLHPEMSARPAVREAFTREGEILANLRHPNIVTFRRCYFEDGQICLVMEKIDGKDLASWAQRTRHDPNRVIDAFRKILEAVDYLHHRATPLLHLDLKPENILVQETSSGDEPTLIDFGIARNREGQGLKAYTPPYAAPEQVRGGQLGCFTDVYALGQILNELLETLTPHLDRPHVEAFRNVAERALQASRRRRFADAGEMLRAFRLARGSNLRDTIPARRHKHILWVSAAAVTVSVVAVFTVVAAYLSSGGDSVTLSSRPGESLDSPGSPTAPERFEPCLEARLLDEPDSFSQELEFCLQRALESNHIEIMNAQYMEVRGFLDQWPTEDEITRRTLLQKLAAYKREIDLRTMGVPP